MHIGTTVTSFFKRFFSRKTRVKIERFLRSYSKRDWAQGGLAVVVLFFLLFASYHYRDYWNRAHAVVNWITETRATWLAGSYGEVQGIKSLSQTGGTLTLDNGNRSFDLDTTAEFQSGAGFDANNSNTEVIANQVQLGRIAGIGGGISLDTNLGTPHLDNRNNSSIVKDTKGGLHVLYRDVAANQLIYKYSASAANWPTTEVSIPYIASLPSGRTNIVVGLYSAMAVDDDHIYITFVVTSDVGGTTYRTVYYGECIYDNDPNSTQDPNNCATSGSNWQTRRLAEGTSATFGHFNSIIATKDTVGETVVHIMTAAGESYQYYAAIVNTANVFGTLLAPGSSVTATLTGTSGDKNASGWKMNSSYNTGGSGGKLWGLRLYSPANSPHVFMLAQFGGGNISRQLSMRFCYNFCDGSVTTAVTAARPTVLAFDPIAGLGNIDRPVFADLRAYPDTTGPISELTPYIVHVVYEKDGQLMHVKGSSAIGATSAYSYSWKTLAAPRADSLAVSYVVATGVDLSQQIGIELKSDHSPFVVFRRTDGSLYVAEYTATDLPPGQQASCPGIVAGAVSSYNWKCASVEPGGYGIDATLLSDALPAISHYKDNGVLRYLTVPFAPTGTYTSPPIDATLPSTWDFATVTVRIPAGTSVGMRVRSFSTLPLSQSAMGAIAVDPNNFCTASLGAPFSVAGDLYTYVVNLKTLANTPGCTKLNSGTKYFQVQMILNSSGGGVDTPTVNRIQISSQQFGQLGSLISQRLTIPGTTPIIRAVIWNQALPASTTARVKFALRSPLSNPTWYDVGGNDVDSTSAYGAPCTRVQISGTGYPEEGTHQITQVRCPITDSAVQSLSSPVEYKITLESTAGDATPYVYQAQIEYAENNSPIVSNVSVTPQNSSGAIGVSYQFYDSDSSDQSFDTYLFYDIGLTLKKDLDYNGTSISIVKPAGLSQTDFQTILHRPGVILVDNEMIKYTYVGGDYVSEEFGSPMVRGYASTTISAHLTKDAMGNARTVPVLIRVTDAALRSEFGTPTSFVSGAIGATSCTSHTAPGCAGSMTWTPVIGSNRDVAQMYLANAKVYVGVSDKQTVRPLGLRSSADTVLDTQPPSFATAKPISIAADGTNVIYVPGLGYKAKVDSPAVSLGALSPTVPDGNDNKMAWCLSGASCGSPSASQLLAASMPSGWSPSPAASLGTSLLGLRILTLPSSLQSILLAAFDGRGNVTLTESDPIAYDNVAPPDPQGFVGRDVSSSLGERAVYLEWSLPNAAWTGKTDAFLGGTRKDFEKFVIYRDKMTCGAPVSGFCEIASLSSSAATSYIDKNSLADDTYIYKIITQDDVGNLSSAVASAPSYSVTVALNGGPRITPSIQNVRIKPVTKYDDPVVILWDTVDANANSTPVPSDSYVAYLQGTTPPTDFSNAPTQGVSTLASTGTEDANGTCTCHKVNLIGLTPGTQYYFELRSIAGTETGKYKDASLTVTIPAAPQAVTPTFTNVQVPPGSIAPNSATVTWNTTDSSNAPLDGDSFVEYGASPALGSYYGQKDSVSAHSVTLPSNLLPSTTYYYRVHTTPGVANSAEGVYPPANQSPQTFLTEAAAANDTQGPVISNITVPAQAVQQNTAQVWFTTDEDSTGFIEFWTGSEAHRLWPATPEIATKDHKIQLPADLQPNTSYSFKVIAYDTVNPPNRTETQDQQPFTTAPPSPIAVPDIQNLRFDPPTPNSVTIYWDTPAADSDSAVFFSKDTNVFDLGPQSNPLLTKDHVVTLVGLTPGSVYYFRVQSKNANNDVAQSATCGGSECRFTTPLAPNPAPTLVPGSISVTPSTFSATISWQTQGSGNSLVQFGTGLNNGIPVYGRTFGSFSANTTAHTVVLPNDLLDGQIYHFRIITVDSTNQIMRYPQGDPDPTDPQCASDRYNCQDPTFTTDASAYTQALEIKDPLKITNVAPLLVTDDMAVIGWTTNRAADSEVDFGVGQACCEHIEDKYKKSDGTTNFQALTRSHAVTLNNLQPKTTYTYKVGSTDPVTDTRESVDTTTGGAELTFTTNAGKKEGDIAFIEACPGCIPEDQLDLIAPNVTNVVVKDIKPNTAVVTWDTDEDSSSIVQYGETSDFGELSGNYDLTKSHSVTLKNLTGGTDYMLIAVSYDASGNRGESDVVKFKTTGTKADKPNEEEESKDEKDQTDKDAGKGLTDIQKLSVEKILEILKGLSDDDAAAILQQLGLQLVAPPTFTGGKPSVEVTQTTATISWNTDKDADSRVAYILGVDYNEKKDNPYPLEVGNTQDFVKKHEVTIVNLEPGTLYHYQIRSRERAGRTAYAPDRTFRTAPIKPDIAKAQVVSVTEHTATFAWKTNVPTKTIVEYINQCKKGAEDCKEQKLSQGDSQFIKTHQFVLKDLASDTDYTATIRSEDENELVNLSKPIKFRTGKDATPPEISQLRTKLSLSPGKEDVVQAVISWKTSELSDTQIFYAEGVKKEDLLTSGESSQLQVDATTNHVVVLNKLRPATVYRFKAVSKDPSGNVGASKEFKIITPRKEESVLELIIRNFEEAFGFLKR